jgi:hypothetical protein
MPTSSFTFMPEFSPADELCKRDSIGLGQVRRVGQIAPAGPSTRITQLPY